MKIIRISAIWCSSCIVTYNKWLSVKEKHPNIEFVELDYDMDDIKEYNIGDVLPVTIFINGEKEISRIEGEFSEKELERVIEDEKMDI